MQTELATPPLKKPRPKRAAASTPRRMSPPTVNLYQIVYSAETAAELEPGYQVLDNTSNPRPDWYEYWPIREFLLKQPLDDAAFYGFFSTKFRNKTNLSYAEVVDVVSERAAAADVMLFSPQPDMGAFFLNIFEQAEVFDPGLLDTYAAFLDHIGRPSSIADLMMDCRHVVFSNYFVARPAFWREWLALNEAMFAICEGPDSPLKDALCRPTTYPGAAQRKVFLQERVASLLLATQPHWRSAAHNPFRMAWSMSSLREHPHEAFISDALKLAFSQHRFPEYMDAFARIRERLRTRSPEAALPADRLAPGQVLKVRHSLWEGELIVEAEPYRLRHGLHHSMATYRLHDDLLLVKWDAYDAELYVRHGDEFRVSTYDRDRRGLNALLPASTTVGASPLRIESISVELPDGMGSAHVRPGTSDILVLEAACLRHEYDVPFADESCDIIVDLGANTGLASVFFAHRYPKATIVAVEPARDNFRLLAANAQHRPAIICVEAAIAPADGQLELQDSVLPGEKMQAWAYRTVDRGSGLGSYAVEAISLPTLMRRYGLGFIDILKIDVEGAEYGLFAAETGAWLARVGMILIETHERFVPGVDALVSTVLGERFREMPSRGECRVFVQRR